jgi:hypothetical protein
MDSEQERLTSPDPRSKEKRDSFLKAWRKRWKDMTPANNLIVSLTGVVALCTLAYSVVSYFQWKALLESNQINRESLQEVQRAFVTFQDVGYGFRRNIQASTTDNVIDFTAKLLNSGNTPAVDAIGALAVSPMSNEPTDKQFIGDLPGIQHINIDPRSAPALGPVTKPSMFVGIVDPVATNLFPNGPPVLPNIFVWGRVTYNDVFPKTKRHLTEFCRRLVFIGSAPDKSIYLTFVTCERHNCNDEYCPDYQEALRATPK